MHTSLFYEEEIQLVRICHGVYVIGGFLSGFHELTASLSVLK